MGRTLASKGLAVAVAAIAVAGASAAALAGAVVGQTQHFEIEAAATPELDAMKDAYRRPQSIPFPAENPYTPAKAALGKMLYYDARLSAGNILSCGTCHNPSLGWGDGLPTGVGHEMKRLGRRSPTIVNAAWGLIFMWDGRAGSLEEQALGPIQSTAEMNLPIDQLMDRLSEIEEYQALFEVAYPGETISPDLIAKSIATYERTVVSGETPFDAWVEGEEDAIPEEAKRGFALFNGAAGCAACHIGWNFTDDSFHDIGLQSDDIGRGKQLPAVLKMQHAFKTPGLREIARRGPYMHDGSLATLEAVIDHYDHGGVVRPSRSDLMNGLGLSEQDKADLVAFLETLTSTVDPTTLPNLPR
jgi:cytochrome c peroxidase